MTDPQPTVTRFAARCLDCEPVITRWFPDWGDQQAWIGPHLDITRHHIRTWEEDS